MVKLWGSKACGVRLTVWWRFCCANLGNIDYKVLKIALGIVLVEDEGLSYQGRNAKDM